MAQLRLDYDEFVQREAEVIVVGPEDAAGFASYWEKEQLPFIGLPDPEHTVLEQYGQEVSFLKLGRMPAQMIIDRQGKFRYLHYGRSMRDITADEDIMALLDNLDKEGMQ